MSEEVPFDRCSVDIAFDKVVVSGIDGWPRHRTRAIVPNLRDCLVLERRSLALELMAAPHD